MIPPMFDMTGRVALVTGSTKGIGRSIAEQFVQHGAKVTVTSRRPEDCRALAEHLNETAGREVAWHYAFDFTKLEEVHALVDAAVARWGKLDTLVGNAYVTAIGKEESLDPKVFAQTLRINVVHNAQLAARALPALKMGGDSAVVFVGSASGLAPSPSVAAYGVSKRALLHMMQDLAVEWGQYGIRVNAVVPGLTRTPGAEVFMGDMGEAENVERLATWPLRRVGQPEELAANCVFMCSPASRFTTGCILVSDGGRTLMANLASGSRVKAPD
ncbi:MAG: SDR family oxidoreductase [Caulobacteraceae bacterium]|nr:SDR family oxidoreductase [Caulobacteraceae bacterium]